MRTLTTLALSALLLATASSQAPPYSRITMDPTIATPTGDVYGLDLARNDYALIASDATNLSRDSGFGMQYYIVSPSGDAERVPIENVGETAPNIKAGGNSYDIPPRARISPDGKSAVIPLANGIYAYRREGRTIKKVPMPSGRPLLEHGMGISCGFLDNRRAVVAKYDGVVGYLLKLYVYVYDIETGSLTPIPIPDAVAPRLSFPPLDRSVQVVDQGRKIAFRALSEKAVIYDLASKTYTEHEMGDAGHMVVDHYANYIFYSDGGNIRQKDLRNGRISTVFTGGSVFLYEATGRKILASTTGLDPNGTDATASTSILDAATGTVQVLSGRQQGDPNQIYFTAFLAPDGQSAVYQAAEGAFRGGTWGNLPYREAFRKSLGGTAKRLVQALTAGGGNSSFYALSRHSNTAIYTATPGYPNYGRLLFRPSSAQTAAIELPIGKQGAAVDVDDAGRYAIYRTLGTGFEATAKDFHLWAYDTLTNEKIQITGAFPKGVDNYQDAVVDDKGQVFFATGTAERYPGLTGVQLFRFDLASRTLTHLPAPGGSLAGSSLGYGGGRIVVTTGTVAAPVATVYSTLSGRPIFNLALPANSWPSYEVTDNHKTLAVTLTQPVRTYLYDLADGSLKGDYPSGRLTPDGDWIIGSRQVTYLPTGATFPINPAYTGLGTPLGPIVSQRFQTGWVSDSFYTNERGYDIVRFRIPILSAPKLLKPVVYESPGGVTAYGTALGAGLENVAEWVEARVDGGDWQRISISSQLASPAGIHTVEMRAKDELGRTSEIQAFQIDADLTAPTLSNIAVTTTKAEATIKFKSNEIIHADTVVTPSISFNGGYFGYGDKGSITLTKLKRNTIYTYKLTVTDRAGNTTTSEELTFKTKAS